MPHNTRHYAGDLAVNDLALPCADWAHMMALQANGSLTEDYHLMLRFMDDLDHFPDASFSELSNKCR